MNIFIFHKIAKFEQIFIEKCKIKQNTKLKLYEEVRRKDNYTKQRRFLFMQKKSLLEASNYSFYYFIQQKSLAYPELFICGNLRTHSKELPEDKFSIVPCMTSITMRPFRSNKTWRCLWPSKESHKEHFIFDKKIIVE